MSGFRTLGFLLLAPFLMGSIVVGILGFGDYNLIITPLILIGEAILVLVEVIKVEEVKMEASYGSNVIDDSNEDGKTTTEPTV